MKSLVHFRSFRTKAEVLLGYNNSSGLLIQTLADKQSKEQNKTQVGEVLQNHDMLSEQTLLISLATTVFIDPTAKKKCYVAGSPHIACGFFDRNLNLHPGAFQSKGFRGNPSIIAANVTYNDHTLVKQDFKLGANYMSGSITTNHFFQTANNVVSSSSELSNGKEENPIVNAGGGFYLLAIKSPICFTTFKRRVASYNQRSIYYDRLNDSCAHAVLESLGIDILTPYALDTQTALERIITHFSLSKPIVLADCLKSPIALGESESKRLQSTYSLKERLKFVDHLKSHFTIDISKDDLKK